MINQKIRIDEYDLIINEIKLRKALHECLKERLLNNALIVKSLENNLFSKAQNLKNSVGLEEDLNGKRT